MEQALEILWKGMLAIFVSVGIIYLSIKLMTLKKRKPKNEKTEVSENNR